MNVDSISVLDNESDSGNDLDDTNVTGDDNRKDLAGSGSVLPEDDALTGSSEDINELLDFLSNDDNAASMEEPLEDIPTVNMEGDMGLGSTIEDVFSDTLEAVDTLEDPVMEDLSSAKIPEMSEDELSEDEFDKKKKEKEKKRNIFKELMFGSEEDDLETEEKEEKKAKKEKKSKKKIKKESDAEESKEKQHKEKKIKVKKTEKPKKPKKQEEEEIDLGVINKYATAIIFTVFAIIAIVVISGTEIVSYSNSIKTAATEFDRQRYDYAYKALRGTDVKEKDKKLYDKVITVMYVNKQLDSYNNFYSVGDNPRALDSLLKGLKKYDKYIEPGKKLGIESDLNYIRNQILAELKDSYQLSEAEALEIIKSKDKMTYSIKIYEAVDESITIAGKGKNDSNN